jgi:ADP-ribosylglycohydrolase
MVDYQPTLKDRYVGCMLGAAIGDAMGKLTEHIDSDQISFRYGRSGVTEPPANALYTDDTQMALATARALEAAGGDVLPRLMDAVVREYVHWYDLQNSPTHRRAPGLAVIDALARIHRGVPYTAAADGGANDSVVATRAVPLALRYHGDSQRIVEAACEVSRMTHGHPAAVTAGAAAALLVEYALSDRPLDEWYSGAVTELRRHCSEQPREVVEAIRTVEKTASWDAEDAMERQFRQRPGYGGGWTAEEAVGLGFWCFASHPDDFVAAVVEGANAVGMSDTDGIACLAGALAGARNGVRAIPAEWIERLEDAGEIRRLAEALYEARAAELAA